MRSVPMSPGEIRRRKRGLVVLSVLAALIVIVFLISINTGYIRLSLLDVARTLFGMGDDNQRLIMFKFRMPRIVIAILVGAGLAVSGCVLQGLSRNALADPGILGINAGAGLMVMLYISFYPTTAAAPVYLMPVLAFGGASVSALVIYLLSYDRYSGLSPTRLLLTGIAVATGMSAAMIVLTLRLSPEKYQFAATWLAGSIGSKNWSFVLTLLIWIVVLLPYVYTKSRILDSLNLGTPVAAGLGVSVTREQVKLLAAAVGLAASCVAVSGGIGFVGLIAPHLARRLIGAQHRLLLPASALIGALLVVTADTLGRSILQPTEIPAGLVVAVIGAPYFFYLLLRTRG